MDIKTNIFKINCRCFTEIFVNTIIIRKFFKFYSMNRKCFPDSNSHKIPWRTTEMPLKRPAVWQLLLLRKRYLLHMHIASKQKQLCRVLFYVSIYVLNGT